MSPVLTAENTATKKPLPIRTLAFCGMFALVLFAYGNHFRNSFHFDDTHAIVENPYVRDLHNIPLFFADGRTSSTLPQNRNYRPVVYTSLAVDYFLGHGMSPLWFHISTFWWFLVQLSLIYLLFRSILDKARPDWSEAANETPLNFWIALFATSVYGVHPVTAETVNYIIQRADLYAALAVVAGLVAYIRLPGLRTSGLYLLPVVLGILSKPPAAVFPALLFGWIWLFEEVSFKDALLRSLPALAVAGAAAAFTARMTPSTYIAGSNSAYGYRITQPAVLLGYFRKFFIPTDLSADTDRGLMNSIFQADALVGILFVLAAAGFALWCFKRRETRPIGFGLGWFLVTSIPTSVIALAEVENDHRMYLPFVGLTLSVCWAAALLVEHRRVVARPVPPKIVASVCALTLAGLAYGARVRNKVWSTEETLWQDVTVKSPNNGRGLMNYGLTRMEKGQFNEALALFNRAEVLYPNYYVLEINLGIVNSVLGNTPEAERHFQRAVQLSPADASARYYYARWLATVRRQQEALAYLTSAIQLNPDYLPARYLMMQVYADSRDEADLRREAQETLARFPTDENAKSWLARAGNLPATPVAPLIPANPSAATNVMTADAYVSQSLAFYQAGKYPECIAAAQAALKLRPAYPEAWNNIGAAWNSMSQWDKGIAAELEALRLKPDFQLARNNLAWAESQKQKVTGAGPQR